MNMNYFPGGNASVPPITFRVRKALDNPDLPWFVEHVCVCVCVFVVYMDSKVRVPSSSWW